MTRKAFFVVCAFLMQAAFAQEVIVPPDRNKPGNDPTSQPRPIRAGVCKGQTCRLAIHVNANCDISIDQQWAFVTGRDVRLLWEILPADYSFPLEGGIEFKTEYNPMWREEFHKGERVEPRLWQWIDANNMPDVFRYTVRVVHNRTGQVCTLDPGVVNDWP